LLAAMICVNSLRGWHGRMLERRCTELLRRKLVTVT
jgi:hypothetical protein